MKRNQQLTMLVETASVNPSQAKLGMFYDAALPPDRPQDEVEKRNEGNEANCYQDFGHGILLCKPLLVCWSNINSIGILSIALLIIAINSLSGLSDKRILLRSARCRLPYRWTRKHHQHLQSWGMRFRFFKWKSFLMDSDSLIRSWEDWEG